MIIRRISLFLHAYAAENQVEAAAEAGDITRTIELADSFVNKNLLSSVRANFYKAMAFNRIEDYPAMAEYIRKIVKWRCLL